jgi:hypothetical protein
VRRAPVAPVAEHAQEHFLGKISHDINMLHADLNSVDKARHFL